MSGTPAATAGAAPRSTLPGLALGIVVASIWAGWIAVSARGLAAGFTPYDLTLLRFAVPALLILPWFLRRGLRGLAWRQVALVGGCIGVPHALLLHSGLQSSTAAHAAIVLPGFIPLFTAVGAWIVFGERIAARRWLGMALILGGVAALGYDGAARAGGSFGFNWPGDLFFVAAGVVWAAFTLAITAWRIPPLQTVGLVAVVSTTIYAPVYLAFLPKNLFAPPPAEFALQAIYQGAIGIFVAMALFTRAAALMGAARAGTISALTPPLALVLSYAVAGAAPTAIEIAGAAVCGMGIWAAVGGGRTERAPN